MRHWKRAVARLKQLGERDGGEGAARRYDDAQRRDDG
jgi:hypothetical protein